MKIQKKLDLPNDGTVIQFYILSEDIGEFSYIWNREKRTIQFSFIVPKEKDGSGITSVRSWYIGA